MDVDSEAKDIVFENLPRILECNRPSGYNPGKITTGNFENDFFILTRVISIDLGSQTCSKWNAI